MIAPLVLEASDVGLPPGRFPPEIKFLFKGYNDHGGAIYQAIVTIAGRTLPIDLIILND